MKSFLLLWSIFFFVRVARKPDSHTAFGKAVSFFCYNAHRTEEQRSDGLIQYLGVTRFAADIEG